MISNIAAVDGVEKEKMKDVRQLFEIIHSDENKDNFKNRGMTLSEPRITLLVISSFKSSFLEAQKADKFRKDILDDILAILTTLGPTTGKHYSVGLALFGNLLQ